MTDAVHSYGDHELASEIAPAMRRKLRRDARLQSLSAGMLTLFPGLSALQHPDARLGDILPWAAFVNLAAAALFFGFALFYPGYLIQLEVRYRHIHGKWRWEH